MDNQELGQQYCDLMTDITKQMTEDIGPEKTFVILVSSAVFLAKFYFEGDVEQLFKEVIKLSEETIQDKKC